MKKIIVLLLLAGAAYGGYQFYLKQQAEKAPEADGPVAADKVADPLQMTKKEIDPPSPAGANHKTKQDREGQEPATANGSQLAAPPSDADRPNNPTSTQEDKRPKIEARIEASVMSVSASAIRIQGTTNLPPGTRLSIRFLNFPRDLAYIKDIAISPEQSFSVGEFVIPNASDYTIQIEGHLDSIMQTEAVMQELGRGGQRVVGPLITGVNLSGETRELRVRGTFRITGKKFRQLEVEWIAGGAKVID